MRIPLQILIFSNLGSSLKTSDFFIRNDQIEISWDDFWVPQFHAPRDASRRFWRTTPDGLGPQNGPRGHGNHRDWKLFWHEDTRWYRFFLTKSQMGIELRLFASATLYVSNFTNKSNKSGAVTFTNLICTQHETRVMSVQRNLPKRLDNVFFWYSDQQLQQVLTDSNTKHLLTCRNKMKHITLW